MSPAVPVPSGLPGVRRGYWFPLLLSGLGMLLTRACGCCADEFAVRARSYMCRASLALKTMELMTVGAIKVHEFIALDGVYENPSWTFEFGFDPKMGEAIGAITGTCRAILLGRRTFEMFAPAWSPRTAEEDPGAPFFNESPKYVVAGSPPGAEWNNSTILGPYRADTIRGLKDTVDGDLYVSGSGTLVRAMLADGLVDELHLFVYPVARGEGERLLADGGPATKFTLAGSDAYGNGVVHLNYAPATG